MHFTSHPFVENILPQRSSYHNSFIAIPKHTAVIPQPDTPLFDKLRVTAITHDLASWNFLQTLKGSVMLSLWKGKAAALLTAVPLTFTPTYEDRAFPSVPARMRHQQARAKEKGIGLFSEAFGLARRRKQDAALSTDGSIALRLVQQRHLREGTEFWSFCDSKGLALRGDERKHLYSQEALITPVMLSLWKHKAVIPQSGPLLFDKLRVTAITRVLASLNFVQTLEGSVSHLNISPIL